MSDIFDDYAKIAIERGLISETITKEAQVGEESSYRFDSLSNDDIKALYDVKPDGESEKHILDQAHPESVYVAPAYDRMNGLVENLFERQDIMAWIARKPNDGKHTQERYVKAKQDLSMALLNTAFMLDRNNEEDLMKLADDCAGMLTKNAFVWVPWILYLGAGGVGVFGLINNFGGMIDNGVYSNSERAIEELSDLVGDNELPGMEEEIQLLIQDITYVRDLNAELTSFNIDPKQDEEEVKADVGAGQAALSKYIRGVRALSKKISSLLRELETRGETASQSSWMSRNLGDFGIGLEKTWGALWGSNVRDALVILDTLKESIDGSIGNMTKLYHSVKMEAQQKGRQKSVEEILAEENDTV